MNSISDRILERELSGGTEVKRERIIGRRLREGYVHYKRYLEILNIVSRHGFGHILEKLRNTPVIAKLERTKGGIKNYSEAVRLRLVFQDLGPTFIKIGQILSTRPDIVPDNYVSELENLKDSVPHIPFDIVKARVERELGGKLNKFFKTFEKIPIGSASIAQVHKAVTKTGKVVAVKVQRPGVKDMIIADMDILDDIAEMFGDLAGISEVMDPQELVDELKRLLTREIDYTIEARSIEHFRRDFADIESVIIPNVHWNLTTKRVLTMDFVKGIKIDKVKSIKKAGLDPKVVAGNLGLAVARMIFVKGYFHGDPHGRNVLVQKSGKLAFLDFGSIGYLDGRTRDKIRLFYFSMAKENVPKATEIFLDICDVSGKKINRPALEQDIREFLDYQRLKHKGLKIHEGMNQRLVSVALKHGFMPTTQFILLERALLEAEGECRKLSPNFDMNQFLMPILGDIIKDKIETATDPIGAIQSAQEYRELMRKGPKKMYSILDKLDSGTLEVKIDRTFVNELRSDIWRMFFISGVTIIALILAYVIYVKEVSLNMPILNISLTVAPIFIIWLVAVWWIYRRWKGPRIV